MALDCGHVAVSDGLSTGVATALDGTTYCYPCADARQLVEMGTADVFGAYVSANMREMTTWSGGTLARVTCHTVSYRTGFGGEMHYWSAVGGDGRQWHGRNGGPGMYVNLYARKASKVAS